MGLALLVGFSLFAGIATVYQIQVWQAQKYLLRRKLSCLFQEEPARTSSISRLGDQFDQTAVGKKTAEKLKTHFISLRPSEFYSLWGLLWVLFLILLPNLFSVSLLPALVITGIVTSVGKSMLFRIRKNQMVILFTKQLPDVCRGLANALRAGLPLVRAIDMLAEQLPNPSRSQLQLVRKDLALGMELDSALHLFRTRIGTRDSKLFTDVILIQHETGGNLAAVLEEMAQTLEARRLLERTVVSMTSEAKTVALLLPTMPLILLLMMNWLVPGFFRPLLTLPGIIMISLFLTIQLISLWLVRKTVNFKV